MTQEALAHAAGITVGHLSTIERGHSNPSWATVKVIASGLAVSMVALAQLSLEMESRTADRKLE